MKQKNKSATIWIIAMAAIIAGTFGVYKLAKAPAGNDFLDNNGAASVIYAVKPDDWFKGGEKASAVLIEYSDFQCPACAAYVPVLEQLNQEFGNDLKIVFRHFPLFQIHPNAISAAQAAEAAGRQGMFWQMHDKLFINQREWEKSSQPKEIFKGYAGAIGIDGEKFIENLNSEEVSNAVKDDLEEAQKLGFTYSPTFILNGKKIQNPTSYEEFRNVISQTISKSKD
jgi:protein-disulfide isomerase